MGGALWGGPYGGSTVALGVLLTPPPPSGYALHCPGGEVEMVEDF